MATVNEVQREFKYGDNVLKDIEGLTPSEIQDHYSRQYPELLNAKLLGGDIVDGKRVFEFKISNGSKG